MKADDRLIKLGDLFKQRNALYGDNYLRFGKVFKTLFPEPLVLESEDDFGRFALFVQIVHKVTRYAQQAAVGHEDSLDDMAVYAQMLAEVDEVMRNKKVLTPKKEMLKSVWEEGDTQ